MMDWQRAITAALSGLIFLAVPWASVQAHPHVWVTTQAKLLFDNGSVTGITQSWVFDELYTAMAIQGLDKDGDGTYTRQELAELAKVNIDGIKDYDYFTDVRLGDQRLSVTERNDYWLEHKEGILTLHFTVTLESPVLAEAEGFSFSVYDPSYFIAYEFAKTEPVALGAGAPGGCTAELSNKDDSGDAQALNEALLSQLGDFTGDVSLTKKVSLVCARS